MSDKWVQNPLILALILLIVGGVINYILGLGLEFVSLDVSYVSDLGFLLIAYILGIVYTKKVGQIMPKGLRFKTVGLFFIFYLIVTFAVVYFIPQGESIAILFSVGFGFGSTIIIIECLVVYWFLGFGGKTYMKSVNKENVAQQ